MQVSVCRHKQIVMDIVEILDLLQLLTYLDSELKTEVEKREGAWKDGALDGWVYFHDLAKKARYHEKWENGKRVEQIKFLSDWTVQEVAARMKSISDELEAIFLKEKIE